MRVSPIFAVVKKDKGLRIHRSDDSGNPDCWTLPSKPVCRRLDLGIL